MSAGAELQSSTELVVGPETISKDHVQELEAIEARSELPTEWTGRDTSDRALQIGIV
jgi:hypothetical protein